MIILAKKKDSGLKYYAIRTKAGQERNLVVDILKHFFCKDVPDIYEDLDLTVEKQTGQLNFRLFGKDDKKQSICLVEDIVDSKGYVIVGVTDKYKAEQLMKRTRKYSRSLLDWRIGERQVAFLRSGKVPVSKRIILEGDVVVPKIGVFQGELTKVVGEKDDKIIIEVIGARFPIKIEIDPKDVVAE